MTEHFFKYENVKGGIKFSNSSFRKEMYRVVKIVYVNEGFKENFVGLINQLKYYIKAEPVAKRRKLTDEINREILQYLTSADRNRYIQLIMA